MSFKGRQVFASGFLILLLSNAVFATELEVSLVEGGSFVDFATDPSPQTTTTELAVLDPGRIFAVATPLSTVSSTRIANNGLADVNASATTSRLEIVLDPFDPQAAGLSEGPGGEVSVPILFSGGVILVNSEAPSDVTGVAFRAQVSSVRTPPSTVTAQGSAGLSTSPFGTELTALGVLSDLLTPGPTGPVAGTDYSFTLSAEILPRSSDAADRTIFVTIGSSSSSFAAGRDAESIGLVRLDILGPVGLSFTTVPPMP